ncbi:MAG: hypothetical protein RL215_2316, partial [Planctomycetota bacterium]
MSLGWRFSGVGGLILAGVVMQSGMGDEHSGTGRGQVHSTKALGCGPECRVHGGGGGRLSDWWGRKRADLQANVTGYSVEFERPPLGMSMHGILSQQRLQAQSARTTLYDYDFVRGSGELNRAGRARLVRISGHLRRSPGVLLIEGSEGGVVLDEARRAAVLSELALMQHEMPAEWVQVIGGAEHLLDSESAELMHSNRLQQTKSQGSGVGAGGSGGSG